MAKHPKLNKITIKLGNGDKFEALSTTGSDGETINVPENWKEHPAWKKSGVMGAKQSDENIQKFSNKYGNISWGGKKKANDGEEAK